MMKPPEQQTQAELRQTIAKCQVLLGSAKHGAPEQDRQVRLVYDAIDDALREMTGKSTPMPVMQKQRAWRQFEKAAPMVLLAANQGFAARTERHRRKAVALMVRAAIEYLVEVLELAPTFQAIASQLQFPLRVLEHYYPGYPKSNLLPVLLRCKGSQSLSY